MSVLFSHMQVTLWEAVAVKMYTGPMFRKYNTVLQLLPVLAGFFTFLLTTVYQAAYPEGYTAKGTAPAERR